MKEYDDKCFDTLFLGATPPATYIRLDRAYVIQSTLMRFSSLDKNKKRFYSRIFGLLLLSESIEDAKVIIEQMFIVMLNRYQHSTNVINAINLLKDLIETHEQPSDISNNESMKYADRNDDTEDNILKQNNKSKFFQ